MDLAEAVAEQEIQSDEEDLSLSNNTNPFTLSLRVRSFEGEAEFKKFIKNVERLVRGSLEYKYWKDYIKEVLEVSSCMITQERMDECTVEIHHHIPSLFIVIKALINKKIANEEAFSTFDIALDTIELHFRNKIGYVALLRSLHEKFHKGHLQIPIGSVQGDYIWFVRNYGEYLDQDDMDVINQRTTINTTNCTWTRDNYPGELEC